IDGISQHLTAAILQTEDWGTAWDGIQLAVAQTFLQMVIRYAASRAAMFAISKIFGLSEVGTAAATASQVAAIWSPAAVAASIATFGSAAAIGTGAYIGALGAGQLATTMMTIPGFAEGG